MKILIRTVIILLAALVVVGIVMSLESANILPAVAQNGAQGEFSPDAEHEMDDGVLPGTRPSREEGRPPGGGFGRHRDGEHEGGHVGTGINVTAVEELVKNLVITAVVIGLVALFSRIFNIFRPRQRSA